MLLLTAVGLSMDAFAAAICKGLSLGRVGWREASAVGVYFGLFQALMPLTGFLLGSRFAASIGQFDHWIAFVLLCLIGGKMLLESRGEKECVKAGEKEGAEVGAGAGEKAGEKAEEKAREKAGEKEREKAGEKEREKAGEKEREKAGEKEGVKAGAGAGETAAGAGQTGGAALGLAAMLPLAVATSIDALAVGVSFSLLEVAILPAVTLIGCVTFLISAAGAGIGRICGGRFQREAELIGGIILILIGGKILLEHLLS
jgi:putative Mn2+ efflux pump MntP